MTPIINSRDDLDALRGTDAYPDALRAILGATTTWINDAAAGQPPQWRQVSVGETLAWLDLTLEDLLQECAAAGIATTNPPSPAVSSPTPSLTELKTQKRAALANLRWKVETGGITVGGITLPTDERTRSNLHAKYTLAKENSNVTCVWKLGDGSFVTLSNATIQSAAHAVHDHVQACFDHEAALAAQIDAVVDEAALAAIDIEVGWPS